MMHGASARCVSANEKMLSSAPTLSKSLVLIVESMGVHAFMPNSASLGGDVPARLERIMKELEIGFFKEGSRGPDRVRRIGDDHIITRRVVCKEFKAIADEAEYRF